MGVKVNFKDMNLIYAQIQMKYKISTILFMNTKSYPILLETISCAFR